MWYLKIIFTFQFFGKIDSSNKYLKRMRTLNEHRQYNITFTWINSVTVSHFCRGGSPAEAFFYGSHHFIGWEYFIFCDITKSIFDIKKSSNLWYRKSNLWYQKNQGYFVISKIQRYFVTSKNLFCDIKKSNLWYPEVDFLILWYHKIDFFFYIKKSDQGYFVISKNLFYDIKNRICDIKKILFCDITK